MSVVLRPLPKTQFSYLDYFFFVYSCRCEKTSEQYGCRRSLETCQTNHFPPVYRSVPSSAGLHQRVSRHLVFARNLRRGQGMAHSHSTKASVYVGCRFQIPENANNHSGLDRRNPRYAIHAKTNGLVRVLPINRPGKHRDTFAGPVLQSTDQASTTADGRTDRSTVNQRFRVLFDVQLR